MTKENLKDIVEQIRKLASPPPKPPSGYVSGGGGSMPVTPAPIPPATAPSGGRLMPGHGGKLVQNPQFQSQTTSSIPIIKAMQQQLMGLARDVVSQINIQDMTGQGRAPGEASGRNSFADFITKNYLRGSDVPGVEFDPDPTKKQMSEKQPTDPTRMNVVMDTMRRIGNPAGGEFKDDGQWGPRTNAALRNAYAYAYALLKLAGDFQLRTSYTEENLAALKGEIPDEYTDLSITQKVDNAGDIIKHLKGIRRMFGEIKTGILEKPAYRAFLENDQPFQTYEREASPAANLNPQTLDSMRKLFDPRLRVSFKDQADKWVNQPIAINDLLSVEALQAWQERHAPQTPLPNILNSIKSALSVMEGSQDRKSVV